MFNFNEAMYFINGFTKTGKPVKDLNRIAALLDLLGSPQDSLKFIHIAGTNGKGSVAQMCSNTLINAGYKTGLFTSPFIVEYSDRIRINNEIISKENLCKYSFMVHEVIDKLEYKESFSQFEISTAIAFLYFESEKCDVVVLEAGIGGRYDCTNVIESPLVSIITSISYDHTKILGETIEEITAQKAGIIKPECPCVVSAYNPQKVYKVVNKFAKFAKSKVTVPDIESLKVVKSSLFDNEFVYKEETFETKMIGFHQIINALSVIEAMNIVKERLPFIKPINIAYGIASATVMARDEVICEKPLILLDGAHNPDGMKALAQVVSKAKYSRCYFIVGMIRDKNVKACVSNIIPLADEIICVDGFFRSALSSEELATVIRSCGKQEVTTMSMKSCKEILEEIVKPDDMVVICGSLYLASQIRGYFVD